MLHMVPLIESPSLSLHSSSSDDIERSPKVKKNWGLFRRSGKSPDTSSKRKMNKRHSGSLEALDEVSKKYCRNHVFKHIIHGD